MNQKYKKYIFLGVVLAIVVVIAILIPKNGGTFKGPKLPNVSALTRITIEKAGVTREFVYDTEKELWTLGEDGDCADKNEAAALAETLINLSFLSEAWRNKEGLETFDLTPETRAHIQAFNGEKRARDLYLGKTAHAYGQTFVMIPGSAIVYSATGNFAQFASLTAHTLRAKKIVPYYRDAVTEFIIEEKGRSYTLTKQITEDAPLNEGPSQGTSAVTTNWTASWKSAPITESGIDTFLNYFVLLSATDFVEKTPLRSAPLRVIKAKTSEAPFESEITIVKKMDAQSYLVYASDRPVGFIVPDASVTNLLTPVTTW